MAQDNPNVTSPTSAKLAEVIDRHITVFNQDELSVLNAAVVELQDYEGALADVSLPVNVDVPYVSQTGDTLSCTMGNWEGEPDNYTYRWQLNGTDAGTDSANYVVTAGDVGKTATCIVTASNHTGSTEAPPSNGVVVADPG